MSKKTKRRDRAIVGEAIIEIPFRIRFVARHYGWRELAWVAAEEHWQETISPDTTKIAAVHVACLVDKNRLSSALYPIPIPTLHRLCGCHR